MERFHRLAHSVWDCKYHIVWIPKYRRKELYGTKRRIVVDTIKQWARIKGIEIIEGHAMPDHIHLCISIPPKYWVAHVIGLLKGKSASEVMSFGTKSSRMVRGRTFWARGYCVSTVGLDEEKVREYIRNQEQIGYAARRIGSLKTIDRVVGLRPPFQGGLMIPPVHWWYSFDLLLFFKISIRLEVQRGSIQFMDQDWRFCDPPYLLKRRRCDRNGRE